VTFEHLLRKNALLPEDKIAEAKHLEAAEGLRLDRAVVQLGLMTEREVLKIMAELLMLPLLDLSATEIPPDILQSLTTKVVFRKRIVPIAREGNILRVATCDPFDLYAMDDVRMTTGLQIDTVLAIKDDIEKLIKTHYGLGGDTLDELAANDDEPSGPVSGGGEDLLEMAQEASVIRLVNEIIVEAVHERASDIHIEPYEHQMAIRYRIDGILHEASVPPQMNRFQAAIISRIKILANLNIAERRIPQDGRIKMVVDEKPIDFRVSSCPAVHGESIVLRILRPDSANTALTTLGLESDSLDQFNRIIRRPNGIFLVTGPTGSGKTTTLYAALQTLNQPGTKIITAEDPVEYQFKGINQCQVREHIGLTFNAILKSMLRQAPNVILVGEIRDREVADIAIQAALTGHLVFSTLHTNDAPSSVTRLIDMGVKPFLVASSIQAVLGQRLVRCLHDCKVHNPNPDPKFMKLVGLTAADAESGQIMGPGKCGQCIGGYKGRRAIFEMMMMNQEIRDLAFQRSGVAKIRAAAIRGGMRTLVGDGRLKILKGITTPEEVAKLAQVDSVE
jgi:type II secretory ATPase GspE/PulE/Tfp pilus assembly ATPase PilB-like protein